MKGIATLLGLIVVAGTSGGCSRKGVSPHADLWLAVVDADGRLHPAGAFTGGARWDGWPNELFSSPTLPSALEDIPKAWLPPGRRFPIAWRGHFPDGEVTFSATGVARGRYGAPEDILTTLPPDAGSVPGWSIAPGTRGVAVVGDADVRLFAAVSTEEAERLIARLDLGEAQARALGESDVSGISTSALASPLRVARAAAATHVDGSRVIFLELERTLSPGGGCSPMARFGVTFAANAGANLPEVASLSAEIVCAKFTSMVPLAVVERSGDRCWVRKEIYAEGEAYAVTSPARWVDTPLDCRLF